MDSLACVIAWAWSISHSITKVVQHWWYGASEIERICDGKRPHNTFMSRHFARSLHASRKLQTCQKLVFFHRPFSLAVAVESIVVTKRLDRNARFVLANLNCCLRDLRVINVASRQLERQRKILFVASNRDHEALLERLWTGLLPEQRFPGPISEEWSLLGWQGTDPSTDLRGMGLLALDMLTHFATSEHQGDARRCLNLSIEPYFPFAATSVVIASFCMDLLLENRLHTIFFDILHQSFADRQAAAAGDGRDMLGADGVTPDEAAQAQLLINTFRDFFCKVYVKFCDAWTRAAPSSIMDFPRVFADFQKMQRNSLPLL